MSNKSKIDEAKWKLFNYAILDIIKSIRGRAFIGSFIQCSCFIDYLTYIALGNNGNLTSYTTFVKNYLNISSNYSYNPTFLWGLRNALVHTYGESSITRTNNIKYSLTHATPDYHNEFDNTNNAYSLNLSNFVLDIIKVTIFLFDNLSNKNEFDLNDNVKRTDELISVYDLLGVIYKKPFKNIDKIFSPLDKKIIDWKKIENNIFKICLGKDKYFISKSIGKNEYCITPFASEIKKSPIPSNIVGTTSSGTNATFFGNLDIEKLIKNYENEQKNKDNDK